MYQTIYFSAGRFITIHKGKIIAQVGFIEPAELKQAFKIYKELITS